MTATEVDWSEATQAQRYEAITKLLGEARMPRFVATRVEKFPGVAARTKTGAIDNTVSQHRQHYSVTVGSEMFDFFQGERVKMHMGRYIPIKFHTNNVRDRDFESNRSVSFISCLMLDYSTMDEINDALDLVEQFEYSAQKAREVWAGLTKAKVQLERLFTHSELTQLAQFVEGY